MYNVCIMFRLEVIVIVALYNDTMPVFYPMLYSRDTLYNTTTLDGSYGYGMYVGWVVIVGCYVCFVGSVISYR